MTMTKPGWLRERCGLTLGTAEEESVKPWDYDR
jgi:hypothetical protein